MQSELTDLVNKGSKLILGYLCTSSYRNNRTIIRVYFTSMYTRNVKPVIFLVVCSSV